MLRAFKAGGRTYNITGWKCKYDNREGCNCCMPKDAVHPAAVFRPGIREFVIPFEATKSRAYVYSPQRNGKFDGSAKSKARKR